MTDTNLNLVDVSPEQTHLTITAQRGHFQAIAFARKGGTALGSLLGGIATAKEVERKGPIQTMLFLTETYDADEQSAIPVVGSRMGETGNKPYDRYTAEVDTDQGKKKIPGSWVTDVVRATDEYIAVEDRIEFIDKPTLPDCPEDISNMGTGERAVERERLMQRKADMRKALVSGIMLYHRCEEVSALNTARIKIKLPIREEMVIDPATKQPVKDPVTGAIQTRDVVFGNTVRLQDPEGIFEDKVLTVGQFQALKPDKIEGEKTIVSLEKTGARAPKGRRKGGTKTTYPTPASLEQFLTMLNTLSTSMDTQTEQGQKLNSKVLAACAAEGKAGDDVVETIGDFVVAMDDNIWTVINARYNTIKTAKAQARNAAAHAATQKTGT